MCGIFGYIGHISLKKARFCTDLLSHRGPDGGNVIQIEGATLGHRRLAIIDLSNRAYQPMAYANKRYWITFNGEIYNFIELRRELKSRGYAFETDSDTEVLLASFVEWGEECVKRLNGMWAFAIWDSVHERLFLSRDRFGKKPLFYIKLKNGDFAFSSEMKALFPLMDDISPNERIVKDPREIFYYESTEECVIKKINRFPAGHNGWLKNGNLTISRYWCTLDNLVEVPKRYEDQVEKFRTLFFDACKIRMRSDVPIGTALSGGLDSSSTISAIAHIARERAHTEPNQDWQHAFIASFPNTPLDETKYAKMVTEHLGIPATFIEIDPTQAFDKLFDFFFLFEEIYITSPLPFMLLYNSMRRAGIFVTLDGHGADECFAGYFFDYLYALLDAKYSPKNIREILKVRYDAFRPESQNPRLPPKFVFLFKWYASELLRCFKTYLKKTDKSKDQKHPAWRQLDHLNRRLYVSTHETVLPTLLRNYDRYSMSQGVEIRMPFLDHRVVCYAFSLPWTSKIRNGFAKAIIRDAMAPFLPQRIIRRKDKIGFNSPTVDWIKGPLKNHLLDITSSQEFIHCPLIKAQNIRAELEDFLKNPHATFQDAERIWSSLSVFFWFESVVKKGQRIANKAKNESF